MVTTAVTLGKSAFPRLDKCASSSTLYKEASEEPSHCSHDWFIRPTCVLPRTRCDFISKQTLVIPFNRFAFTDNYLETDKWPISTQARRSHDMTISISDKYLPTHQSWEHGLAMSHISGVVDLSQMATEQNIDNTSPCFKSYRMVLPHSPTAQSYRTVL